MGKYRTPEKPKGMKNFCNEIDKISAIAGIFKRCESKVPNYIFKLDKGEGRQTAIKYAAEVLEDAGLLDVSSGPEKFIYITYDGTSSNYYDNKRTISNAAVYKNKYTGLIACEPIALAEQTTSELDESFISFIGEVGRLATVFFFVDKCASEEEDRLISRIAYTCNARIVYVNDYNISELADICEERIEKYNVHIDNRNKAHDVLLQLIKNMNIENPKDAVMLARSMLELVDFDTKSPILKYSKIKSIADKYCK